MKNNKGDGFHKVGKSGTISLKVFTPLDACLKGALVFLLSASFPYIAQAQRFHIKGQVLETFSKIPLSFVHVTVNDSVHSFTDIDGYFNIHNRTPIRKMDFSIYMHRPVALLNLADSLIVTLNRFELFKYETGTDRQTRQLVEKIFSWKRYNDSRQLKSYSYATYNKFTISAGKNDKANKLIASLPFKMKKMQDDQHLLIIESVTEKKYLSQLYQKEVITGAKSSNVTVPSLFIQTAQLQAFSIYDNYITIGGKEYTSPLSNNAMKRYAFSTIDRFFMEGDSIYVVKFNPIPDRKFPSLKGLLFINSRNYGVQSFIAGPAEEGKVDMKVFQSYKLYQGQTWFPDRTKTQVISSGSFSESKFIATGSTYVEDVKLDDRLSGTKFDEVVLEYNKDSELNTDNFWTQKRKEPLSHRDSATYAYYNEWDSKKAIQKFLSIGEHLSYGIMPIGRVNIDIKRLFNYNQVEGIRLGLGMHTNERFSKKVIVGGYGGYGFKDKKAKFGLDYAHRLSIERQVWYKIAFAHDLNEAGEVNFSFDRFQYSSEILRKFRLRILDMCTELENTIISHPIKYLDLSVGVNFSRNVTSYTYNYKGKPSNIFDFAEARAGFRFAYGEQQIKFLSNKKFLGTKFPVLYFQYTKAVNAGWGAYDYVKYDVKIEQSFQLLNVGISTFQLIGGLTHGDAPYTKLYNMRGSLKSPSLVIHNSFETMRYNEFLSDRYIALFFTHNLGRIYVNHPNIQPSILIMHNMGLGAINHQEYHTGLPFVPKTMEKGYVESGAFADNVLVLNLGGLKTGLGAGLFLRYGYYASLKASDNVVFKFSTNFAL